MEENFKNEDYLNEDDENCDYDRGNDDWGDQRTWGQKNGLCDMADNCYGCSYADQCF